MKLNQKTIAFLLLRKNTKLLKEYISETQNPAVRDQRRDYIIGIKRSLSALSPDRYNLFKTIATEIDRFVIKGITERFNPHTEPKFNVVQYVIQGTDIVVREEIQNNNLIEYYKRITYDEEGFFTNIEEETEQPRILYDKILNIYFLIYTNKTVVDDVVLFTDHEHLWFAEIFNALQEVKNAEEEIIKQQQVMEALRKEKQRKESILSKYSRENNGL